MGRGKTWTKTESKESRRPRGGLGVGLRGAERGSLAPDRCLPGCDVSVSRAGVYTGSLITWVAEKIEKKSRVRPTAQGPREKHSSHQSRDMCFALDPAPNQ